MEEMTIHTKCWSENMKVTDRLEDLGADRRTILECILEKQGKLETVSVWVRIGTSCRCE